MKLRVRFFKKIQDWILKSENGFCVSFLNRLYKTYLLDYGVSKEPKNPLWARTLWFLRHAMIQVILDNLFRKETQNLFLDLRIQCWIFLKKRTLKHCLTILYPSQTASHGMWIGKWNFARASMSSDILPQLMTWRKNQYGFL